jgi:dihydroorotase-like cyclic amidohydrolase
LVQTLPATQAWSVVPTVEHAPQLALSVIRSWHLLSLHRVVPATHEMLQVLALQTLPAAQAWSLVPSVEHAPQLALSVIRSWHLLSLHRVVPATHET